MSEDSTSKADQLELTESRTSSTVDYDTDSAHPPVSPKTPAESFFLPQLGTSQISAFALASEINKNSRRAGSSRSNYSGATDDFASAVDNAEDLDSPEHTPTPSYNLFGKDVLVISREPIPEDDLEFQDSIMSQENHVDVAQHVYEGAKDVWAWGKGVGVFKPFLGLAEGIASKVVSVAGSSLGDIDGEIKPKLAGLDDKYINPAVNAVVGLILSTVSKTDEFVRPIIMTVLGPIGLAQIEDGESSSSKKPLDTNPETTTPVAVMN